VGRPRLTREECVWQDIRILGVKNWRSVASNREEWRTIPRKARAHTGLSCQCCYCCCCCCWWWWWVGGTKRYFLSMALQPCGLWPLFQFLNPIHSR
jgi:hypothetical protein